MGVAICGSCRGGVTVSSSNCVGDLRRERVAVCVGVAVWVRELRFLRYAVWQLLCIGIVFCGSCDVGELWCVGVAI